jgi:hypothetical protein
MFYYTCTIFIVNVSIVMLSQSGLFLAFIFILSNGTVVEVLGGMKWGEGWREEIVCVLGCKAY